MIACQTMLAGMNVSITGTQNAHEWSWIYHHVMIIYLTSLILWPHIRKFSIANWKNRRPSFDLLRKVIQGRPSLRRLLARGRVGQKEKSVLGYGEHGKTSTLVLFRFQMSSSGSIPVPPHFQWGSFELKFSLAVLWNWKGNSVEVEQNGRNWDGIRSELVACFSMFDGP